MKLSTSSTGPTASDFRRDGRGWPVVQGRSYQRASGVTKAIEDTFTLEAWQRRNVLFGMAHDSSLVARVLAVGGDPSSWDRSDKDQLDEIVAACNTAAKAHRRADIGTALHALIERRERGEAVQAGEYAADIEAYFAALAACGVEVLPEFVEVKFVNHEFMAAGTADNVVMFDGMHTIGDKKTGGSADYLGLGATGQLATYAAGVLWDVERDCELPTPEINQHLGLIFHVPAGEGRCTVYQVPLAEGRRAVEVVERVKLLRRESKRWLQPVTSAATPAAATLSLPVDDDDFDAPMVVLSGRVDLDARQGVSPLPSSVDASSAGAASFPLAAPALLSRETDGGQSDPEEVKWLLDRAKRFPAARMWMNRWLREANDAAVSWDPRGARHLRHFRITEAALRCARAVCEDDDIDEVGLRDLLEVATKGRIPVDVVAPFGELLGLLELVEATRLADMLGEWA